MSNTFTRDPLPRIQYGGDGSRTTFAFPFEVLNSDDLLVYLDGMAATGFAISGLASGGGGEIEFAQPPAAGTTVTLLRRTEGIRETAFVDGGPFRASAINAELDRIMMLIQEDREEHGRSLRAGPAEGALDFCLPPAGARANKLLGFDSSGAPMAMGHTEVPDSGDASGVMVTPNGASTARSLGEHLAAVVNVRDFGALGNGVDDDGAAFQAAIAAAASRSTVVYVPASPTPYLIGSSLVLDGVAMLGEGAESVLKLAVASGAGIQMTGAGARLARLCLLGPAATAWPATAAEVDLSGVSLDGVRVTAVATGAVLYEISIAGCHTGLAVEGQAHAVVGCSFRFNRKGVELRAGAAGPLFLSCAAFQGCSSGLRADAAASIGQVSLHGGDISACGLGFELDAPAGGWRNVELSGLRFVDVVDAALKAGPRQSVAIRGAHIDPRGRRNGTAIDLLAGAQTIEAPSLIAENVRAETTQVVSVQLSGGTNLNLLQPGDLIVLASDPDDVDDFWTSLKATRGGIAHRVPAQTASTATVRLARGVAAARPAGQHDPGRRPLGGRHGEQRGRNGAGWPVRLAARRKPLQGPCGAQPDARKPDRVAGQRGAAGLSSGSGRRGRSDRRHKVQPGHDQWWLRASGDARDRARGRRELHARFDHRDGARVRPWRAGRSGRSATGPMRWAMARCWLRRTRRRSW